MNRVANIRTTRRKFFHQFMLVTQPLHHLGKTETAVLAELLYFRNELSKNVKDEKILNKLLFDYDTKHKICDAIGIKEPNFRVVIRTLNKKGIIKDKQITKAWLIGLNPTDKIFKIEYRFNITDDGRKKKTSKKVQKDSE